MQIIQLKRSQDGLEGTLTRASFGMAILIGRAAQTKKSRIDQTRILIKSVKKCTVSESIQ